MKKQVKLDDIYAISGDIVVRQVKSKIIIIPLAAAGDGENEMYTLNPTGQAVWQLLDGKRKLKNVTEKLIRRFNSPAVEIEKDTVEIVENLLKNGLVVEISKP